MERMDASAELIERLLNEFDLAPKARQFVLSLKSWNEDRGLTNKQLAALKILNTTILLLLRIARMTGARKRKK